MRTRLFALMTALLLLAGCSRGEAAENRFRGWQKDLEDASGISFSADITADYGEKVMQFRAIVRWSDGVATVELRSPDSIAGITLRESDDGTKLEYDGASLELGSLNDAGLSPAAALPLILRTLKSGRCLYSRSEREGKARYEAYTLATEGGELTAWFVTDSLTPIAAELSDGERVNIFCRILEWDVEERLT